MRPSRLAAVALVAFVAACSGGDLPPSDDAQAGSGAAVAGGGRATDAAERADAGPIWQEGPRLPAPVGNNAVAAVRGGQGGRGVTVLSFLGIDSTKVWSGVTNAAYRWDMGGDEGWREIAAVPGPGRLAPTVQVLGGRVFVFGGYTVGADGSERSVPEVNVYDPMRDAWGRAAEMSLPVDDAVSGVWGRTLIYLVSGWHDDRNVADVQLYDPVANRWSSATPIPGEPVFGHSGAIFGNDIIYVGGAKIVEGRPRFVVDRTAWRGRIDSTDPSVIAWEEIEPPPGPPLYRAAAGVLDGMVVLLGGTDNPYNYDGIGYDGVPSSPTGRFVGFDPRQGWVELPAPPVATMDHRTLAVAGGYVFVVGGMTAGQRVSDRVWYAEVDALLAAAGRQEAEAVKALVVGATGTIGAAVAAALEARGHQVVRAGHSSGEVRVDISDRASIERLYDEAGAVDAVVCTAGLAPFGALRELTDDGFALGIASKMMGQVNLVRSGLGRLADGASFTLTTGTLTIRPTPGSCAVAMVGGGVEAFVRAAALDLAGEHRINAVSPGWVAESRVAMGLDPMPGIWARDLAEYYVCCVEGDDSGLVVVAESAMEGS